MRPRREPIPDAVGLDLRTKPTISGTFVTLRPFREGDAEVMAEILSDPEVRALTGSVATTVEAHAGQPWDELLVEWYATRSDQPDRLDLAVEDVASGRLVGEVVLNELDRQGRSCNLRVLVGPAAGVEGSARRPWASPPATGSSGSGCGGSPSRCSRTTHGHGASTRGWGMPSPVCVPAPSSSTAPR